MQHSHRSWLSAARIAAVWLLLSIAVGTPAADTSTARAEEAEAVAATVMKREWGPEQAAGEPDTFAAGDIVTAWASATEDGQREWLMLHYAEAIEPKSVMIHETFNPGAVDKVSVFDPDGKEVVVWTGEDPTPRTKDKGVSVIPVKVKFKTKRVKIYIDSPSVPGWNEIDAVGLRGSDDAVLWAESVEASSTYASVDVPVAVMISAEQLQRFQRLEQEVEKLKKKVEAVDRLQKEVEMLKKLLQELKEP